MGERTYKPEESSDVAPAANPLTDPYRHALEASLDSVLHHRSERPHLAMPFSVDKDHLTFAGIVGRSSVGLPVTVSNRDSVNLRIDARLEGAGSEFQLESTLEFIHPHSNEDGRATADIGVRYTPTSPGPHEAVLVLTCDAGGQARVNLRGSASALEQPPKKLDGAELASPLMPLPPLEEKVAPREQRAHLDEALDSLSRMAEQYNAALPPNDAANAKASHRMIAAVQQLNGRVLRWLQSEGVSAMAAGQEAPSGAAGVIKAFLLKGIEFGLEHFFEIGGAPLAAVMFAVELGDVAKDTVDERSEQREQLKGYKETMDGALLLGANTQDAATSAVLHKFGGALSQYASRRAEVRDMAGAQAIDAIGDIQHIRNAVTGGADATYFHDKARELVSRFRVAMQEWGAATGQMEVGAGAAEEATTSGYETMLDRYLEFRMERAAEEAVPMKEIAGIKMRDAVPTLEESLETVVVEGGISFSEPVNIQFNTFRFGEYKEMSDEMRRFAGTKVISTIKHQPVEIRLFVAEGGMVTLRQYGDERTLEADGEVNAYVRRIGQDRLWAAIRNATLGPKVIKVL